MASPTARPAWQERRNRFNHDWLKNSYLLALGKWMNILDDQLSDRAFEEAFLDRVLPQWEERLEEGRQLLDECYTEAAPASYIKRELLADNPPKDSDWLSEVYTVLWWSRGNRLKKLEEAKQAFDLADDHYRQLKRDLLRLSPGVTLEILRSLRDSFDLFYRSCSELGRLISNLPREASVI